MQQYLIYSQSDQRTLRAPELDSAFHGVAVPGTIIGYFPEATAAFILASKKPYFIDIKTPLFQGELDARPSHVALAQRLSPTLAQRLDDLGSFDANFYRSQPALIEELVSGSIAFQRNYAGQGATL